MVRKVRVVLEYELGSFPAHQQLPSHGQAPARRPLTFALGVSQSHPSSAQPYCLSWASMLCPHHLHLFGVSLQHRPKVMSFAAQVHSGAASSATTRPVAFAMAARNFLCASVWMLNAFTFIAAASSSGAAAISNKLASQQSTSLSSTVAMQG